MAKIKKAIDWEGDFLNIYDQIERKDLSPSAIEHKWTPFGIKKEGTAVNAELLNDFQKNGIYGTLNTVKEIINSVERYIIKDFYGIEEFGVFEELKLKIKISDANNEDNPKLVLNSIEYSMIYSTETSFVNIKKGQLEKNKIYNLIFNGVAFIVESSSLKATADSSGLMSLSDIRKEIANLSGASYSGIFGSELKNIIAGNSYLYVDNNGKGIMYKALNTKSNTSGFLAPDTTNFQNLSNVNLVAKESAAIQNNGSVSIGNIAFFWGFLDCFAVDAAGTAKSVPTGYTFLQSYIRVGAAAIIAGSDYLGNAFYTKLFDINGNRINGAVTYLMIAKKN